MHYLVETHPLTDILFFVGLLHAPRCDVEIIGISDDKREWDKLRQS